MIDLKDPSVRRSHKWIPGIYVFKNIINGKCYVGSAKSMGKRIMDHLSNLRCQTHCNNHLQAAWDKYGSDSFEIFCLEQIENDQLLREREQYWIDDLGSFENGYNLSPIAERPMGFTFEHTEEAKQKIGLSKLGKAFSDEHKANLSIARKSYSQPREVIEKARLANTGKKRSEESISRIREARGKVKDKARETIRKSPGRKNASGYKGVYYHKNSNWQARLRFSNGKEKSLGCFLSKEEAAKNYDFHSIQEYGVGNCYLNFPNEDYAKFIPLKSRDELFDSLKSLDTSPVSVTYNPKT